MPTDPGSFLLSAWAAIESNGIRAVVMRNYESLPYVRGDLDILVHPAELERARLRLLRTAREAGWRVLFEERVANHDQIVFWHRGGAEERGPHRVHLDLQNALGSKGFHYAAAEPFLSDPVRVNGVWVPVPEARAVALGVHTLLDKGTVREDYREAMRSDSVAELEGFAESVLPTQAAQKLCRWIRAGAPEEQLRELSRSLRADLIRAHPLNRLRPALVRMRRWLRMFGPRRGVLVAFLGPDGAGKSTILEAVQQMTPPGPFPVRVVYMGKREAFLPTSRLIRLIYDRQPESRGSSPESDDQRSPRRTRIGWLAYRLKDLGGILNWILEQWSRYLVQVRPCLQQGGVVLTDRYAYDFGNHDPQSLAHRPLLRAVLRRIFPVPDRTYLLWEDPEILHERKPEATPAQAAATLERMRRIVRGVPTARELRTNRAIAVIAAEIADEIACSMESRCGR